MPTYAYARGTKQGAYNMCKCIIIPNAVILHADHDGAWKSSSINCAGRQVVYWRLRQCSTTSSRIGFDRAGFFLLILEFIIIMDNVSFFKCEVFLNSSKVLMFEKYELSG